MISYVLTLLEKKTRYYLAIKIPSKTPGALMMAMDVLHEEYAEHFSEVFKTITADNVAEFARLFKLLLQFTDEIKFTNKNLYHKQHPGTYQHHLFHWNHSRL